MISPDFDANRARALIVELAPMPPAEVTAESELVDDLGYDSLGLIELVVALEQEFGMQIGEEQAAGVATVGDAEELLASLLAREPQDPR